jgi:hypothetical protein
MQGKKKELIFSFSHIPLNRYSKASLGMGNESYSLVRDWEMGLMGEQLGGNALSANSVLKAVGRSKPLPIGLSSKAKKIKKSSHCPIGQWPLRKKK